MTFIVCRKRNDLICFRSRSSCRNPSSGNIHICFRNVVDCIFSTCQLRVTLFKIRATMICSISISIELCHFDPSVIYRINYLVLCSMLFTVCADLKGVRPLRIEKVSFRRSRFFNGIITPFKILSGCITRGICCHSCHNTIVAAVCYSKYRSGKGCVTLSRLVVSIFINFVDFRFAMNAKANCKLRVVIGFSRNYRKLSAIKKCLGSGRICQTASTFGLRFNIRFGAFKRYRNCFRYFLSRFFYSDFNFISGQFNFDITAVNVIAARNFNIADIVVIF